MKTNKGNVNIAEEETLRGKRILKNSTIRRKVIKLDDFSVFGKMEILIPEDKKKNQEQEYYIVEIDIKELLWINKDVPPDVLSKQAACAANYARFGNLKADLEAYFNTKNEQLDNFLKVEKNKIRPTLAGNASEGKVEEKALFSNNSNKNFQKYKELKKEIRLISISIERVKRILYSFEIMSESARSITSFSKKEWEMVEGIDKTVTKRLPSSAKRKN